MRRINRTGSSKDVKMDYKNLRRGSKVDTDMSLSSDMEDFDLEEADKYEDKLNEYQRQRDTRMGTSMGTATRNKSYFTSINFSCFWRAFCIVFELFSTKKANDLSLTSIEVSYSTFYLFLFRLLAGS